MPRNTNLSSILFPVELRPVGYVASDNGGNQPTQPELLEQEFKPVKQYKAVVRADTGDVFAVVSSRYELLHNSRALDLGKQAFHHLFPEAKAEDFIVFDVQSTKTGSACHIDLIHKKYSVDVWEQETWLPFLRVSNSYNRSRALTFDLGFVRKLCSNGVIFRKETIRARFYHTKGEIQVDLTQDPQFQRLKVLEQEFTDHMNRLRQAEVENQYLLPLSIFLLGLDFDLQAKDKKKAIQEKQRLHDVRESLSALVNRYIKELGANAYTALNAATDFATHSPATAGPFATSATLQSHIGDRSREFLNQINATPRKPMSDLLAHPMRLVG